MDSFLNHGRPIITAMLKSSNTSDLVEEIEKILAEGTDTFGFQMELLEPKYRNPSEIKTIISAMQGKAAYVTNYHRCNVSLTEQTDEELTEEMLMAISCGAKLFDLRGDLFNITPGELTLNDKAIAKQIELVKGVHKMGGEVLMSSHILKYAPTADVIRIAKAHAERGADISKIVTEANSEAELFEAFEITMKLKKELPISSLFLCNGSHCAKHRVLGPMLGSCMYLAVENSTQNSTQPKIETVKTVLSAAGYTDLP